MLEYRDTKFEYKEWYTWDSRLACCYTCSDEKLLEGLDITSFSSTNLDEMHAKIDNYIDNKAKNIVLQQQANKAVAEFYNTNHYKGD